MTFDREIIEQALQRKRLDSERGDQGSFGLRLAKSFIIAAHLAVIIIWLLIEWAVFA